MNDASIREAIELIIVALRARGVQVTSKEHYGTLRAALAAAVPLLTADAIAAAFDEAADEVRDQYGYNDVRLSAVEEFLRRKARIARSGGTQ